MGTFRFFQVVSTCTMGGHSGLQILVAGRNPTSLDSKAERRT